MWLEGLTESTFPPNRFAAFGRRKNRSNFSKTLSVPIATFEQCSNRAVKFRKKRSFTFFDRLDEKTGSVAAPGLLLLSLFRAGKIIQTRKNPRSCPSFLPSTHTILSSRT